MQDQRRAVLERVARGELTPAEAASLLEEIENGQSEEQDPRDWAADWNTPEPGGAGAASGASQATASSAPPVSGSGAARIRVTRTVGSADIIGDPSVREAVAEGPHVARREGDMLVIESRDEWEMGGAGFRFDWPESGHRHHRMRHGRGFRWDDHQPLRVRVNPDLPLEVDAQAGRVRIRGVHGPIRANVQAGSTDIVDFRSPFDIRVQAGSVSARGRLDGGSSRVTCEAGSVRVQLERGSSVRVTAHTTLGKVSFDNGARSPWTIGGGEGALDIDATMGTVRVSAD